MVWQNVEGFHDVTLVDGPDDFSFSPAGSGWTHQFVFTKLGEYNYECSVGNHSQTQFGTITVEDISASSQLLVYAQNIQLFPNPTSSIINVEFDQDVKLSDNTVLVITDATGKQVEMRRVADSNSRLKVDMSEFSAGMYIVSIVDGSNVLWSPQVIRN